MEHGRYWIVSSNVRSDGMHAKWRATILDQHVAFMGWSPVANPQTRGEIMGTSFAKEIGPRDAVLITHGNDRQLVAVGRVAKTAGPTPKLPVEISGHYKKRGEGSGYSSYKRFDRFVPLHSDPARYRISFAGTTGFGGTITWALYEFKPTKNRADAQICRWMDRMLARRPQITRRNGASPRIRGGKPPASSAALRVVSIDEANSEDYFVLTKDESRRARRKENVLVNEFRRWLKGRNETIERAEYLPAGSNALLFSDGYVKAKNLLIEAKSEISRNFIRLAIGQLFDYARLHEKSGMPKPRLAILLPASPGADIEDLLKSHRISIISRSGNTFRGYPG